MTPKIRNRLVGSIILVTAGIVIIPSVLDGEKISKNDFKAVPAKPEFSSVKTAKTFPGNEFDQHLPDPDATEHDDVALDAEEIEEQVDDTAAATNNSAQPQGAEVMSNESITVATIGKPVDFDKPADKTAKPRVIKPREIVQSKPKKEKPKPTLSSPFTSSAWVIQLGAFGRKANATALEKKLNAAGFVTFNRPIQTRSGTLTKVYVGPELDKKVLAKSLPKINKLAGLSGKLVTFTIKR